MSEDDDHILPVGPAGSKGADGGELSRRVAPAGRRVLRGVGAGLRRVRDSRLGGAVEGLVRSRADALADWLREPEHVHALQGALARVAQFGMERGFDRDPDARLLFEFADWIEVEHGRLAVISALLDDSPLLDGSLLGLLEAALQPWAREPAEMRRRLDAAQASLMRLLARLASLETGEAVPPPADREVHAAAFRDQLIPERFHPLADKALGRPGSFAATTDTTDTDAGEAVGGSAAPKGLQRFIPSMQDPATRFVAQSYVFFLQTYLTRAMLESFPEVMSAIDALEASAKADEEDDGGELPGVIDL